ALGIAEQYEMLRKVGIENSAEQLLLMTQYFDTMQDVARNGRSNVLYLPSNPGAVGGMGDEIRTAMLQSQAAAEASQDAAVVGAAPPTSCASRRRRGRSGPGRRPSSVPARRSSRLSRRRRASRAARCRRGRTLAARAEPGASRERAAGSQRIPAVESRSMNLQGNDHSRVIVSPEVAARARAANTPL